jgi:hypothetical protein
VSVNDIISSGMLELYASDMLSGAERAEVEQWCQQHPEVAAELAAIETSLENYARAGSMEPAPAVKDKVFAAINAGTTQTAFTPAVETTLSNNGNGAATGRVVTMNNNRWKWLAAASVALLVASTVLTVTAYNRYKSTNTELVSVKQELEAEKNSRELLEKDFAVIQSKYSDPIKLSGQAAAPDAAAKVFWIKNNGEVYVDPSNLPAAPEGKQYQLWAFIGGQPVDAGMINYGNTGKKIGFQKMKSFEKVEAFAITLEKTGGVKSPEGQVYVLGKVL